MLQLCTLVHHTLLSVQVVFVLCLKQNASTNHNRIVILWGGVFSNTRSIFAGFVLPSITIPTFSGSRIFLGWIYLHHTTR